MHTTHVPCAYCATDFDTHTDQAITLANQE